MATATSATGRPSRRSTDRYVGLARSGGNGATHCSRSPRALASLPAGVQSAFLRQTSCSAGRARPRSRHSPIECVG